MLIYARCVPSSLTAEQMQRITADFGCALPTGDVICINSLDTFEALCDYLEPQGVTLHVIEESGATLPPMTEKEAKVLGTVWLAPQLPDRGG